MDTLLQTSSTPETREDCIDWCNKLLRGERSAVETYGEAIKKSEGHYLANVLQMIRADHEQSVRELEENVRSMGGTPDADSGAWGTFAEAIQKAANLLGEESAVESLQKGEKHGLETYKDALASGELMPECVTLFTESLVPRIESHLAKLDRLEEQID